MEIIKDFDADSYELEFEEDTPEEERRFYVEKYPNVNLVARSRVHCTTCNTHIGCAVANEATICMHPILRVTHCKKCHEFYKCVEFRNVVIWDEDGSEASCRWCGERGELYCCSNCPYVFCKECIVQNLPTDKMNEVEDSDIWNCFSCSPRQMWDLRAQHWALVNYIKKTKQKILRDEKHDKIDELMNRDPTSCCREKKMVSPPVQQKTATNQLEELACTPDILNKFSETGDVPPVRYSTSKSSPLVVPISAPVAMNQTSATSQPPIFTFRQLPALSQTVRFPNHQFSVDPRAVSAHPLPTYCNVNGFRVYLNAAAQRGSYRLPNGKLNQVKRQTSVNQANASNSVNRGVQSRANNTNPNPDSIWFNVQPRLPPQPVQMQPTHQSLHQAHLQQQQQILNGMNTGMSGGMISGINTIGINNAAMVPLNTLPTVRIANKYPSPELALSQSHLETQIKKTQEFCQQTVGKLNALKKSNAYKSVRNYNDLKELHLHLSDVCKYTIDCFETAHEKCTKDMQVLSDAHEAANKLADKKNKYTDVDDDLEVVEPTTVCIVIDSDDENDANKLNQ